MSLEGIEMKKVTMMDIRKLQLELKKEEERTGMVNTKRAIFLKTTINRYARAIGSDIHYEF